MIGGFQIIKENVVEYDFKLVKNLKFEKHLFVLKIKR